LHGTIKYKRCGNEISISQQRKNAEEKSSMKTKMRLDLKVQELYPHLSRTVIQSYIMQGKVTIDEVVSTKAGTLVSNDHLVQCTYEAPPYVSRAGVKLAHALTQFNVDPTGLVVLDAGLSTGGFTDCLLQKGAAKVYGVDVGYGQVHDKIRRDERVIVMEKTNLRTLISLPELVDLVTLDLSFISIGKVLPALKNLLASHGEIIALIKPQFEAERHEVGKGGIIRDSAIHDAVLERVGNYFKDEGYEERGVIESPIRGAEGNKEFLGHFRRLD